MTRDDEAFDRLVALGRERGGLTTEDIAQSLPVERMTAEQLAAVIVYLEEADIPVEIDPAFLSPRHRGPAPPEGKPLAEAAQPNEPTKAGVHALSSGPTPSDAALRETSVERTYADGKRLPFSAAGVAIAAAAMLALIIMVFVLWRFL